ncbi:MAG: DegT/DnrJ/EryC1/StrS family aminotransferase [Candidatus Loosdrechtia sp.]|uniref:DegT/DnrJ/EryC1/StrS family aminotransferase n=1 Tax=Candidatus Loosdrechtia sp. TaxID=3101272 RepID=UPI003A6B54C5|nr:MAG: DegT/DnrJ/EryC1/StrS family aminotransferase [Candidatus Jettenia sp. AMX2]
MKVIALDLKRQYEGIREEIQRAVFEVIDSQSFILGPFVESFEHTIAKYCSIKHAIGVSSGTDALLLALMACDVRRDDEVITTPFTFFATAGSIVRLGANPVFIDIDPVTYNMDVSKLESVVNKKTKVILPVHLYGQCADMDPILKIANVYGLRVIEDAAQAIGALYKGKHAGSLGNIGCFSFYPSKNLGGYGDGGLVTTNDDGLAGFIKMLRVHGSKPKYYHSYVGINGRLDAIQAAILSVKLKYLDQWSEKRRLVAAYYNEHLKELPVQLPKTESYNTHIFHQYVIATPERNLLMKYLEKRGIETTIYYPVPLHLQKCFEYLEYKKGDLPVSEKAAEETLALPIFPEITQSEQDYVIGAIKDFFSGKK